MAIWRPIADGSLTENEDLMLTIVNVKVAAEQVTFLAPEKRSAPQCSARVAASEAYCRLEHRTTQR